jgi:hypothetical protein
MVKLRTLEIGTNIVRTPPASRTTRYVSTRCYQKLRDIEDHLEKGTFNTHTHTCTETLVKKSRGNRWATIIAYNINAEIIFWINRAAQDYEMIDHRFTENPDNFW